MFYSRIFKSSFSLQYITPGHCSVLLRKSSEESIEWAKLENEVTHRNVSSFVSDVQCGLTDRYLFDWSLPLNCPHLAEELEIPSYFCG